MDEMDKITIIHESDAVIEHYMEPEIYRYLDEKV